MQVHWNIPRCALLLATVFVFGVTDANAADPATWPQWRGPLRDCRVVGGPAWPATVSKASLRTVWSGTYSPSYSGPIVGKDRVFITETRDKKMEVVRALDRRSGKELWKHEWAGAMTVPFFAWSNGSWIRATPAYDGERLYVAGMRDVLVCLDAATGREIWRTDFVRSMKSPLPSFGFVCSPLIEGDSVYVQAGGGFARLNKVNGKVIWHTLKDGGGMMSSAFSSPVVANIRGVKQFVVQTRKRLAGVDIAKGNVLWSVDIPAFRGMNILTPTVIGDRVFTSSYGGGSFLYEIKKSKTGSWTTEKVWTSNLQGYMSSPVVIDGHIYLHMRNQRLACLEAATGSVKWITRPFGKYWSMAVKGDRILALDQRGELLLIRANPKKFDLIARHKFSEEPTWAHLAVCGSTLYIRGLKTMAAYRWQAPAE